MVQGLAPTLATHVRYSRAAESRFIDGLARVARPIEHNQSYARILGDRLPAFFSRFGFSERAQSERTADDVIDLLDRSMVNRYAAIQLLPPGTPIAWGKTRNNLREFDFFKALLVRNGLDERFFNVSYHRQKTSDLLTSSPHYQDTRSSLRTFLESRERLSLSSIYQLVNYVQAYLNWQFTFAEPARPPRVVVLANDHSPNQAACLAVAKDYGVPTIYIQHAEVTHAFPPLSFDISILRNHASLDTYRQIGPVEGSAYVISRDETPFEPQRFSAAKASKPSVGVYLTAQVVWQGVRDNVSRLNQNPNVRSVFVKPHPSMPRDTVLAELPGINIQRESVREPHVCVVANSSVVVELLHSGNIVFQNYDMDSVPADYYGFSEKGIAPEIDQERLASDFWSSFQPDGPWLEAYRRYDPWAVDDYQESERELVSRLQDLFPAAPIKPQAHSEGFCRDLVNRAPYTVIDYVNSRDRFAPKQWHNDTANLGFISAIKEIFNDRVTNSYESFGTTRRVAEVNSELVYWTKCRDIELTGRETSQREIDEMVEHVRRQPFDPATSWPDLIEFLVFLLRQGKEKEVLNLFGDLPAVPVKRLGINRRIGLMKWLRHNHEAQAALKLQPANLYSGLTAFQQLKLRILSVQGQDDVDHPWSHETIETDFARLTSPGLQAHFAEIFEPCYAYARSRMKFMDVRWSLSERQRFYELIGSLLEQKTPFSLIRLSDREAYMFADGTHHFTIEDIENCERHWWRLQLDQTQRARLTLEMRQAAEQADMLGIPSIYRLLRENDTKSRSLLSSLQGRGLSEVARVIASGEYAPSAFTEEKCNIPLFSRLEDVRALGRHATRVVLVASSNEQEARRLFASSQALIHITIPTHSRTLSNDKYAVTDKSLPEVYTSIRDEILNAVEPGDLVLVAAGIIGKIFVDDAKQAGGVALDIGTCLDDWLGAKIQALH